MEDLLRRVALLEKELKLSQAKQTKKYLKLHPDQEEKEFYRDTILYEEKYLLVTLTFDPKVLQHYDQYGQSVKLNQCIDLLTCNYYSCLELHAQNSANPDARLHAHIMCQMDYHEIQPILHKMKKFITNSMFLTPAIDVKPVQKSKDHYNRTYDYIWDDKKDHPKYKCLKIMI